MIIDFIKKSLNTEPKTIFQVPWNVDKYNEVMKLWHDYKYKNKKMIIEEEYKYILRMMFEFHLVDKKHVMVFYSNNKDTCLCMAKYNGRNINIEMPVEGNIRNAESSFVATYCP